MSDALREMEEQVGRLSKVVVKAKAEYDNKLNAIEEERASQNSQKQLLQEVCLSLNQKMIPLLLKMLFILFIFFKF